MPFFCRTMASRHREDGLIEWKNSEISKSVIAGFYGIDNSFDWSCVFSRDCAFRVGIARNGDVELVRRRSFCARLVLGALLHDSDDQHRRETLRAEQSTGRVSVSTVPRGTGTACSLYDETNHFAGCLGLHRIVPYTRQPGSHRLFQRIGSGCHGVSVGRRMR